MARSGAGVKKNEWQELGLYLALEAFFFGLFYFAIHFQPLGSLWFSVPICLLAVAAFVRSRDRFVRSCVARNPENPKAAEKRLAAWQALDGLGFSVLILGPSIQYSLWRSGRPTLLQIVSCIAFLLLGAVTWSGLVWRWKYDPERAKRDFSG